MRGAVVGKRGSIDYLGEEEYDIGMKFYIGEAYVNWDKKLSNQSV
jgi:hypothetical protein